MHKACCTESTYGPAIVPTLQGHVGEDHTYQKR